MNQDEDDEFWKIALEEYKNNSTAAGGCGGGGSGVPRVSSSRGEQNESESDDNDNDEEASTTTCLYKLCTSARDDHYDDDDDDDDDDDGSSRSNSSSSSSITLHLSSLSLSDGAWSPLGAHAWYGSALLASLFLMQVVKRRDDRCSPSLSLSEHRLKRLLLQEQQEQFTALELGSGAVGLAGLALGWVLALQQQQQQLHEVILTDNDPKVLQQLQANVQSNVDRIRMERPDHSKRLPKFTIGTLDWDNNNDEQCYEFLSSSINSDYDNDSSNNKSLQLIFGSELVYTLATAQACAAMVSRLLQQNQNAMVVLVQTVDRDGWRNVFLPHFLQQQQPCFVVEECTVDLDVHDMASTLIPRGGTLDRFDFGVCYIYNKNNNDDDEA